MRDNILFQQHWTMIGLPWSEEVNIKQMPGDTEANCQRAEQQTINFIGGGVKKKKKKKHLLLMHFTFTGRCICSNQKRKAVGSRQEQEPPPPPTVMTSAGEQITQICSQKLKLHEKKVQGIKRHGAAHAVWMTDERWSAGTTQQWEPSRRVCKKKNWQVSTCNTSSLIVS